MSAKIAWILALRDLRMRLPVNLTSRSSIPWASRRAISVCPTWAASAANCDAVRKPLASALRSPGQVTRSASSFSIWQMPIFCRSSSMSWGSTPSWYSRRAIFSASRVSFACSTQAWACTNRSCCTASASRRADESSVQTVSPALTRLPSGRIEIIAGAGGALVDITPWSGSVARNGIYGSTVYEKLRIAGRVNEIEEPRSADEVEAAAPAVEVSPVGLPARFVAGRAVADALFGTAEVPLNLELAAAIALVTAASAESLDDDEAGAVRAGLERAGWGWAAARGPETGRPMNDSTRHRTTSSTELSSIPFDVTTKATSPWSTSTVKRTGREPVWDCACQYTASAPPAMVRKPAAIAASHRSRLSCRCGAGMTSACAPGRSTSVMASARPAAAGKAGTPFTAV